ncbi:MAG: T9SS type A sorting domain-containing protein [Flavobacteriales bacterium]
MKKALITLSLFTSAWSFAQNQLHQVLVVNEGYFDYQTGTIVEPVTIGSYHPTTQQYQVVDTLENMRFASDLVIDGNFYYVAADSKIFKMDLNTHQEVSSVSCAGVRNLAVYQDKLVATRGEYLTTYDSYLHVYNTSDLQLLQAFDTVTGPKWATQNIVIDGSIAYLVVNNAYDWGNEKGIIGQLDLSTLSYGNEVDLGPDGKNPDNLVKYGSALYTVNNKDWTGTSVSKFDLASNIPSTVNIANAIAGCGTSALRDDKITYQISMESTLNNFDINGMNNVGPVNGINLNFYELAQEPLSGNFYASTTDFFSTGNVYIYDAFNTEIHQFAVGVSPGTIVFDIRSSAGIMTENKVSFNVAPNPSNGMITIEGKSASDQVSISDINGNQLMQTTENMIDLATLPAGIYFVHVQGNCQKVIKL